MDIGCALDLVSLDYRLCFYLASRAISAVAELLAAMQIRLQMFMSCSYIKVIG